MKSRIDWNEIVPKLAEGLRQTLYLQAVDMLAGKQRDYELEYAKRAAKQQVIRRRRSFTETQKRNIVAYHKIHGTAATKAKYKIHDSMLNRWKHAENGEAK